MKELLVDIAIVGGGTAGIGAYIEASKRTDRLVLINGGPWGTTCARVGCMPSKLLIAAGEVAHTAAEAAHFGVHAGPISIDGPAVMRRVRDLRDGFVGGTLKSIDQFPAHHRLDGYARLIGPDALEVDDHTRVHFKRLVLAPGGAPAVPRAWREQLGDRLSTNDDVFEWETLPASLIVVGTGVIGLELAQALQRLGVDVTVIGQNESVGPLSDPQVRIAARDALQRELRWLAPATVHEVARDADGVLVTIAEGADGTGARRTLRAERLLAATGRRTDWSRLNLDAAGLKLGDDGRPPVDVMTGQWGDKPVFVAGDATAWRPLLHEASDGGRIAGANAADWPELRAVPRKAALNIVFTHPGIAVVGDGFRALCERKDEPFACGSLSFENQGRSKVMRVNAGVLRVYGRHSDGRFLGLEICGPEAEHLAHLGAWALQQQLLVSQMLDLPYYHPTVEEGFRTALRGLMKALRLASVPPEGCLDCGPGV